MYGGSKKRSNTIFGNIAEKGESEVVNKNKYVMFVSPKVRLNNDKEI